MYMWRRKVQLHVKETKTQLNLSVFFNWVKEVIYYQSSLILNLLDYNYSSFGGIKDYNRNI